MVRDAILWRGHCQGGDGKLERRKGLPVHKKLYFQSRTCLPCFCTWLLCLSLCRESTRNITRTQKTKLILCKQTHPCMTQIRRLVLLPVRWVHKAHAHTLTQIGIGVFLKVLSHVEDTTESWPMSQSRVWVNTLTWWSPCFVPTQTLHDWVICIRFNLIAPTECVTSPLRSNDISEYVEKKAFQRLYNSWPPTRSHTMQTSVITRITSPWLTAPRLFYIWVLQSCKVTSPTCIFFVFLQLWWNCSPCFWFSGPIQEGLRKK